MSVPIITSADVPSLDYNNFEAFSLKFLALLNFVMTDHQWPLNEGKNEQIHCVEQVIEALHNEVFGPDSNKTANRRVKAAVLGGIRKFVQGKEDTISYLLMYRYPALNTFKTFASVQTRPARDLVTHPEGCFATC